MDPGHTLTRRRLVTAAVTSVICAALLWSAVAPPAAASHQFSDVPEGHVFHEEISWLAESEITEGFPDGTFRPGAPLTRQALAAFLYRLWVLLGQPVGDPAEAGFSDVPVGHAFHEEISWLAESEITEGFPDGTFRPGVTVVRQALASFFQHLWDLLVLEVDSADDHPDTDPGDGACLTSEDECTLRAAIMESNVLLGRQQIHFAAGVDDIEVGTGGLADDTPATGDLDVADDVVVVGDATIIRGMATSRVLDIVDSTVELVDLTIRDGTEADGGGIRAVGSDLTLDTVLLTANLASAGDGGGLHQTGGSLSVVGSDVTENRAELTESYDGFSDDQARGGGLHLDDVAVTVEDSTIALNVSVGDGGGVHQTNGTFDLDDSSVRSNLARAELSVDDDSCFNTRSWTDGRGGGLAFDGVVTTITSAEVTDNGANGDGGGLHQQGGTLEISTSEVGGNEATGTFVSTYSFCSDLESEIDDGEGGGVWTSAETLIDHSTFEMNVSSGHGGGLRGSTVVVDTSTFTGNSAEGRGLSLSAIPAASAESGSGRGGALTGGDVEIVDSTIAGNTATSQGAGVSASRLTLDDSTVSGNDVGYLGQTCFDSNPCEDVIYGRGGGLWVSQVLTATNVTIQGNHADVEGGGALVGKDSVVRFATITGNEGGGLLGFIAYTLLGSIVAENVGADCQLAPTVSMFNLSRDPACGPIDPDLFTDEPLLGTLTFNGGPTLTRLPSAASPAVDAVPIGTASLCDGSVPADQRGAARLGGTGCDVGAVER